MDAAQMLTAQEIARQCEQLARAEAARADWPSPARGRHLRLAEPTDEPAREELASGRTVVEQEAPGKAEPSASSASGEGSMAGEGWASGEGWTTATTGERLGDREWELLAFERQWWKHPGAKEKAIRELFDMSASRYYQLLNAVVDKPAALRADPMLVKRLRKVRASRQRARDARRLGIEWH